MITCAILISALLIFNACSQQADQGVSDIDGNTGKTATIGAQELFAVLEQPLKLLLGFQMFDKSLRERLFNVIQYLVIGFCPFFVGTVYR